MTTRDRSRLLTHYFEEGCWDGVPVHLVGDGPDPDDRARLHALASARPEVTLDVYDTPQGAASAKSCGVEGAGAAHLIFCDDDDVMLDLPVFARGAAEQLADDDILLVATPKVFAFDGRLNGRLQYDRAGVHGHSGIDVLTYLVHTGEMLALMAGTAFRREDLLPILPDSIMHVSEDFLMIARLCARHPDRRVEVSPAGAYVRLRHDHSLSAPQRYTREKATANMIAYAAAVELLVDTGVLQPHRIADVLRAHGRRLHQTYGRGRDVAEALLAWLGLEAPANPSDEARAVGQLIERHAEAWPVEIRRLRARAGTLTPDPA